MRETAGTCLCRTVEIKLQCSSRVYVGGAGCIRVSPRALIGFIKVLHYVVQQTIVQTNEDSVSFENILCFHAKYSE